MSKQSAAIVPCEEAGALHAFGEEVAIRLDGERTGGKLIMWTKTTPPSGGPPPHCHLNEDAAHAPDEY